MEMVLKFLLSPKKRKNFRADPIDGLRPIKKFRNKYAKNIILFFGAGPNQYNFIKYSIKKNYNIVIHNKKKIKEIKLLDQFIYGSVYKK